MAKKARTREVTRAGSLLAPWLVRAFWGGLGFCAVLGLTVIPFEVRAACEPSTPSSGNAVRCSGPTPEGFLAPSGVENLSVLVVDSDSSVGDAGAMATAAISVNSGSVVTNRGVVTTDVDGNAGLFGTNDGLSEGDGDTTLTNGLLGVIEVNGIGGAGIRGEARPAPIQPVEDDDPPAITARIFQSNEGQINVNANEGVGMDAGDRGRATNSGTIQLGTAEDTVDNTVGISGGAIGTRLENLPDGIIEAHGDFVTGIRIGADNDIDGNMGDIVSNRGTIRLTGSGAVGMDAGGENNRNRRFINDGEGAADVGLISIRGANGIGMRSTDGSDVRNLTGARIEIRGQNAIGIEVQNGSSESGATPAILNEGEIVLTLTGLSASGISAGNDNDAVRNDGTIDVSGESGAAGIRVGDRNEVENRGSIIVDSIDAHGAILGDSGLFENLGGSIVVTGAGAIGVEFLSGAGRLDNNRSMTARGMIEVRATGSVGVLFGSGNDTLNNAGGILAMGDGAIAVDLGDGRNTLTNTDFTSSTIDARGWIEVGGFAPSAPGIAILGGSGIDEVFNSGDIIGDIDLGAGNDRFELTTEGTWVGSSESGLIHGGPGFDRLFLTGTGIAEAPLLDSFRGFEELTIEGGGTWSLAGNARFESVLVSGGDDRNTVIELDGVVNVSGIYVQRRANLNVLVSSRDRRMLRASEIDISSNQTVLSLELAGDANGSYTILQADVLAADFSQVLFSSPRVSTGSFVVADLDLNGILDSLVVTVTQDFALDAESRNQDGVGNALSLAAAGGGAAGDFQDALAQLAVLPAENAAAALDQLSPAAYDAQTSTMIAWGRSLSRTLEARPVRCESFHYLPSPAVRSKAPCSEQGWQAWIEGIGLFGSRDGDEGFLSFEHTGGGVVFGVDKRFGDRWWASASLGSARIGIDLDGNGTGTLQTADVGAAVGVLLGAGHLRAILNYGQGWHTTRRDIGFLATRATGEHQSNRLSVAIDAGYPLHWQGIVFEPLASVYYTSLRQQAVNETGGAGMRLGVAERTDSFFSTSIGARVSTPLFVYRSAYQLLNWADGVWIPELTLRWRGVWSGADRYLDARMLDAPKGSVGYRVDARDAKWGAEFGARVNFQPLDTRVTFALEYSSFLGDGTQNHHLGLAARVPF